MGEPPVGIEPTTPSLPWRCSATELQGRRGYLPRRVNDSQGLRRGASAPLVFARQQYHRRMRIRLAELADAEAIRAIYNVEVLGSTNTFDMVPRTRAEQEDWILEHSGVHPALVATEAPGSGTEGPTGANGEIVLGF